MIPLESARGAELDVAGVLHRIDELDRDVRAFVPEADRPARVAEAARTAPDGPLRNVLVGVKDIIRVDGLDTRAGSELPPDVLAGPQATIVDRVQAAGGIVAGKTVTAEFADTAPGPTRNPRDLHHTPGGSSSGSAAAVAAGMVPLALGTQTVGSVIRPAAFCGVVGFRPTWGLLPSDGVIPNARSLDTIGFFTADVRSLSLAADVLCEWTPTAAPSRPPTLGVPAGDYLDAVEPASRRLYEQQVRRLEDAGYAIRRATLLPDAAEMHRNMFAFRRFEFAQAHREWFARYGHLYRSETAAAVRDGETITPAEYAAASAWRDRFIAATVATMGDAEIDAWVTPAAPGPAPRGLGPTGNAVMSAPFSFAGMPALALPTGDGELPHGLQFAAAPHADQSLIAWAGALEAAVRG